jgi:GcrA cell cycle regulator
MEWTEAVIAELRRLWAEGLSTAEIGRRLGVSKNAVVGKAHRLGLDPRPSPIRRVPGEAAAAPVARRVSGPTLPPLPPVAAPSAPQSEVARSEPPAATRPAPQLRPVAPPAPRVSSGRFSACCWPIGEPGTASFHFCGSEAMSGKPYCAEHAQLAYVKVRDRREDAA